MYKCIYAESVTFMTVVSTFLLKLMCFMQIKSKQNFSRQTKVNCTLNWNMFTIITDLILELSVKKPEELQCHKVVPGI